MLGSIADAEIQQKAWWHCWPWSRMTRWCSGRKLDHGAVECVEAG